MLFNSGTFLFVFLPVAVLGFWVLGRGKFGRTERTWLVLASLVFYVWSDPRNVVLILDSIALNYSVGNKLRVYIPARPTAARILLTGGIAANLSALAYFKYMDFLRTTSNSLFVNAFFVASRCAATWHLILHLRADRVWWTRSTGGEPHQPLDYAFFVLFFPRVNACTTASACLCWNGPVT